MSELTPKQQYQQACRAWRCYKALDGTSARAYSLAYSYDTRSNYLAYNALLNSAHQVASDEDAAREAFYNMPAKYVAAVIASEYAQADSYVSGNWLYRRNSKLWDRWVFTIPF